MKVSLEFEDLEKTFAMLVSKAVKEEMSHLKLQSPVADDLLTREETAQLLKVDLSTLWR